MKPIKICNQGNLINFLIAFFIIVLMIPGCDLEHTNKRDGFAHNDSANLHLKLVRTEIGEASWYGPGFHGKKTASGEIFDQKEMTAAHPSLPMGTEVKVTNLDNGEKLRSKLMIADLTLKIELLIYPMQRLKNSIWKMKAQQK